MIVTENKISKFFLFAFLILKFKSEIFLKGHVVGTEII